MKKKVILILALGTVLAYVLHACGGEARDTAPFAKISKGTWVSEDSYKNTKAVLSFDGTDKMVVTDYFTADSTEHSNLVYQITSYNYDSDSYWVELLVTDNQGFKNYYYSGRYRITHDLKSMTIKADGYNKSCIFTKE